MLIPFGTYASVGIWLYLLFPRSLLPWAGVLGGVYLAAMGVLIGSTLLATRIVDWQHHRV